MGHWDNYWGNMNNYYLYKNPKTGKFEYIPYDTDNTFGIDWIGGNWGTKNVFTWASTSASTRPLINKIMGVAEWKNRYAYYLKQLKDTHFNLTAMGAKIDALKNALYASADNDPLRSADYGWTMTDYVNSFDAPLGGHVAYGLKPYITTRNNSTTTQIGTVANIAPIVRYDVATPQVARGGTPIQFTAQLEDESTALTVKIFIKEGASTLSFDMKDDGLNGDGIAGDKTYTYQWVTNNRNASLTWYMTASDGVKTTTTVERSISLVMQSAFINELLASNSTGITDEVGEFEDWIELYNGGTSAINLNGTFLTDDPAVLNKWALPNQMLNANSRILVWADNQLTQGTLHANFKLEKNGESVVWSRLNGTVYEVIDRVDFGVQVPDKSYSRSGDGGISWFIANAPTPNLPNQTATAIETELPANLSVAVFPNPFVQNLQLTWQLETPQPLKIDLVDVLGRERALIFDGLTEKGSLNWESQFLASGVYWIRLKVGDKTYLRRIVKLN